MRDLVSCYSEQAVQVSDLSCSSSAGGRSSISGSTASSKSARQAAVQSSITCLYRSRLSTDKELLLRISWTKSLVGQGLSVGIDGQNPLVLTKKKGNRSYVSAGSVIGLYWDLSSAKYGLGPEPEEGFYVVFVADKEFGLLLGDLSRNQIMKFEESLPIAEFSLVSRTEQVLGTSLFSTKARFRDGGKEHEISIRCKEDTEMLVSIDKKKVLHVKRLRWNFRGNQTLFIDGLPVDMLWDVHDWWWLIGDAVSSGHAVFMFRTRSGLESRLWLEEELLQQHKSGFSLAIHAYKPNGTPQ